MTKFKKLIKSTRSTTPKRSKASFSAYSTPGQTLIETLAAIFMLIMGITAALGLAIYALNSSTNVSKQIIAAGLAREGVEAVKAMRDTNWLRQSPPDTNCYDFTSEPAGNPSAVCYKNWLGVPAGSVPYCLAPTNGNDPCSGNTTTYNNVLRFDPTSITTSYWVKYRETLSQGYGLVFDPTGSVGFYSAGINADGTNGVPCTNGSADSSGRPISDYCRKITLTQDTTAPYNKDVGPMLKVQSRVWWVDKKCPRIDDWNESAGKIPPAACRVEINAYLTNWKDY